MIMVKLFSCVTTKIHLLKFLMSELFISSEIPFIGTSTDMSVNHIPIAFTLAITGTPAISSAISRTFSVLPKEYHGVC